MTDDALTMEELDRLEINWKNDGYVVTPFMFRRVVAAARQWIEQEQMIKEYDRDNWLEAEEFAARQRESVDADPLRETVQRCPTAVGHEAHDAKSLTFLQIRNEALEEAASRLEISASVSSRNEEQHFLRQAAATIRALKGRDILKPLPPGQDKKCPCGSSPFAFNFEPGDGEITCAWCGRNMN